GGRSARFAPAPSSGTTRPSSMARMTLRVCSSSPCSMRCLPETTTSMLRRRRTGFLPSYGSSVAARIRLVQRDSTRQEVDAFVTAANSPLLGGGGVDGAIHRAGGPAILEECRLLGGCETGQAKATGAGRLPARHVIHAVGPVWRGGGDGEDELLASCHRVSLALASELDCRTVAFPAISTGVYRFPGDRAARIAIGATAEELGRRPALETVTFVLFDAATLGAFEAALGAA